MTDRDWETIPGNSNLTFNNDNGSGLELYVWSFLGTDFTASSVTEDAWATYASAARTKDNTSTWYTTNDATLEFTGFQLEVGSVATDFEHRSLGQETLLCQRYYAKGQNRLTFNGVSGRYNFTTIGRHIMRAAPTVTGSFASQGLGSVEGYGSDATNELRQIYVQTTAGSGLDGTITYEANAEL